MSHQRDFQIWAASSTTDNPDDAVTGNSLVVGALKGEEQQMRAYWRGERLQGARIVGPIARSITNPVMTLDLGSGETMTIDGQRGSFTFRGETLYVLGGGFNVEYDATADQPVF